MNKHIVDFYTGYFLECSQGFYVIKKIELEELFEGIIGFSLQLENAESSQFIGFYFLDTDQRSKVSLQAEFKRELEGYGWTLYDPKELEQLIKLLYF